MKAATVNDIGLDISVYRLGVKVGTRFFRWDQVERVVSQDVSLFGIHTQLWAGGNRILITSLNSSGYFNLLQYIAAKISKDRMDETTLVLVDPTIQARKRLFFRLYDWIGIVAFLLAIVGAVILWRH